jgi:hypothetical protein
MDKAELIAYLETQGYMKIKEIPGKGLCGLREFLFTVGLCHDLEEHGFGGRWCYAKEGAVNAVLAIDLWNGDDDPPGPWIKYKGKTEYNNPKTETDG